MNELPKASESRVGSAMAIGKDAVALLRDLALFVIGVLLLAFPGTFNAMLINAGFREGSIAGFKWQSSLVQSDDTLQKAQANIAELKGQNDKLSAALAEAKAQSKDSKFGQRIDALQDENRKLKDDTQQVQAAVSQTIQSNAPLVEKAVAASAAGGTGPRSRSDYSVGVQTVGVPEEERKSINAQLSSKGYGLDPISWSYPAGERPSWFAPHSTVFYYAPSALPTAQDLARFMKETTGQDFAVQKGAGLGVVPSRRDVTIFINYNKS